MAKEKKVFKIHFFHLGKVYSLFAKEVTASPEFYNMCVISQIIFQRNRNLIVPTEDEVRSEFANIKNLMIPLNHVFRIDELENVDENDITSPKAEKTNESFDNLIKPVEFFKRL